jgi:hypothetical protein
LPNPIARRRAWIAFGTILAVGLAALLAVGRLRQPPEYHDFADRRPWLGIPNAADVLSNVPLFAVAVAAAIALRRASPSGASRPGFLAFAIGLALTSVGSVVYHLDPRDSTLVWDRLPLAPTMAAVAGLLIVERLAPRRPTTLILGLIVANVAAVLLWAWTLRSGDGGDVRAYHFARTGPVLCAVVATFAFPEPRASRPAVFATFLGFAIASAFEVADRVVFDAAGGLAGGHTLKHLFAAVASACFVRWFRLAAPVDRPASPRARAR